MAHPLFQRLSTFAEWSEEDLAGLALLAGPSRSYRRLAVLRNSGDPEPQVYLLRSGWVIASISTADGERQITKVHLPGDLLGMPSFGAETAVETLQAISAVEVEIVPSKAFSENFRSFPRAAAMLFSWSQEERVRLMFHMVGHKEAIRRLSAFLLSLHDRVVLSFDLDDLSFFMPMSQRDLADATGMTTVHVNRCLKTLREDMVLTIAGGRLMIHNLRALRLLADAQELPKRRLVWD